jgi:hypothetical protein
MESNLVEYGAVRCLVLHPDGPVINEPNQARDLVEEALSERANAVAVPVQRLGASFFVLRTGLVGEVIQKMVNYRLRFAIVGDISGYVAASDALRDFVVECQRGTDIIFVDDQAELEERLTKSSA